MTKTTLYRILFSCVVVLSIVSFIYLNTVNVDQLTTEHSEVIKDQYNDEEEPAAVSLPDVEMVKKIIESSKKVIRVF